MSHVVACERCSGLGWAPSDPEHARVYSDGWFQISSQPCPVCICHDCGAHAGEYEVCIRAGVPQPVCLECAVMSGDDAYNESQGRQR